MGRIGGVLSFLRTLRRKAKVTEVKCDIGGGYIVTGQQFAPSGDDSMPLPGDYSVLMDTTGTGNIALLGYVDPLDQQLALPGEKRLYARNVEGFVVATAHLKNDGTIISWNGKVSTTMNPDGSSTLTNGSGTQTLLANGDINLNGVVIKPDGTIISPKIIQTPLIEVDGKELKDHIHGLSGGGTTEGNL